MNFPTPHIRAVPLCHLAASYGMWCPCDMVWHVTPVGHRVTCDASFGRWYPSGIVWHVTPVWHRVACDTRVTSRGMWRLCGMRRSCGIVCHAPLVCNVTSVWYSVACDVRVECDARVTSYGMWRTCGMWCPCGIVWHVTPNWVQTRQQYHEALPGPRPVTLIPATTTWGGSASLLNVTFHHEFICNWLAEHIYLTIWYHFWMNTINNSFNLLVLWESAIYVVRLSPAFLLHLRIYIWVSVQQLSVSKFTLFSQSENKFNSIWLWKMFTSRASFDPKTFAW